LSARPVTDDHGAPVAADLSTAAALLGGVLDRVEAAFADLSSEEMHRLDRLRDCVRMLDGRARRLCELRYGDDLKPAAIAPLMGMTANTVAKALQRVRDRLRECIEHRATVPG
jgi:RNA polymerase sigma-70 factor (ECF subfamily)